jgi:hypothetical protein
MNGQASRMEKHMARFSETAAADIDLEELEAKRGGVTFIKLAELEEIEFTVLDARIEKSDFNENKTVAQVTLRYPDQDPESDDAPYQFSTEQLAIKKQVQAWIETKQKFPVEGCTVRIYAGPNFYGNYSYCLANAVPDEEPEPEPVQKNSMKPPVRDLQTDTNRQRLSSRPVGRTLPKGR